MNHRPSSTVEAHASLVTVSRELRDLEEHLDTFEREMRRAIHRVPADRRESARNLVHYLALRQRDLRDLQNQLAQRGLSSLGRSESCVMASLLEVAERVHESLALRHAPDAMPQLERIERARLHAMSWESARARLHEHTRELLGPRPEDRHIYVMVTAPSAKEADRAWMVKLLRAGMNVLRVNCAHEAKEQWSQICAALGAARKETGKECRILFDLAGPKIRTGTIGGGHRIATWKPTRDEIGRVTAPARVVIRRASAPLAEEPRPFLVMDDDAFAAVKQADELRFRDVRGKKRTLRVHLVGQDELVATADARAYVLERLRVRLYRQGDALRDTVLRIEADASGAIDVRPSDPLVLTARPIGGRPPLRDKEGKVEKAGIVSCTLPAALDRLEVGHRVLFDDGCVSTVVERVTRRGDFHLRVVRTSKPTFKLRAEKGINLPDTATRLPSLTKEDLAALKFAAGAADAIGLSFVHTADDVRALHAALDRLGCPRTGVVLKIETRAGFESLPRLLLEGLRRPPLAVMIARGDLAVEVGFERLAEIQEEILWLCEASHVPAIWATQVLDTMARTGVPSRAEVTDAAAGVAAECVMLNKGPFVAEAVTILCDILRRMEKHRYKKRSMFRKLRVSMFTDGPVAAASRSALDRAGATA